MPRIQWERLPAEKWAHLRDRARERQISRDDLFALAEWKAEDPEVPDGDWYKDFGTFNYAVLADFRARSCSPDRWRGENGFNPCGPSAEQFEQRALQIVGGFDYFKTGLIGVAGGQQGYGFGAEIDDIGGRGGVATPPPGALALRRVLLGGLCGARLRRTR